MKQAALALSFALVTAASDAAPKGFNYDEEKVPEFELPDPLEGVTDAKAWPDRRVEIFALLESQMFGKAPKFDPENLKVVRKIPDRPILDGKAVLSQPAIEFAGRKLQLLIVKPAGDGPHPAFLGYNFGGNHTVHSDPAIALATGWVRGAKNNKANDGQRGEKASRWDIPAIIGRGYALVTAYNGDVGPDHKDDFGTGVQAAYPKPEGDDWGAIATWAWGLSRALDYLETDPAIDAGRVAVIGHSRLGKTSLWAGASDERFALVISNNSGCGGAALSKRRFGETVARINTNFPHWFCDNFKKYNGKEDELPFDQHMLMALMAPRPLYVASAVEDKWADPRGEFLAASGASPVYRLLGKHGLPTEEMPAVDSPVHGDIGYHIRSGKHDVTSYDWKQYLDFADRHLKK